MPAVNSRQTLINYCLRKLGAPLLEINVDEDQLDDRVTDALEYFQEFHSDGARQTYLKHQITATDITNKYIPISDLVLSVSRILPYSLSGSGNSIDGVFANFEWQLQYAAYDATYAGSIVDYDMSMQYLELLKMKFGGREEVTRYSRYEGRLYLDLDWSSELKEGDYIVIECFRIVDPEEFNRIFNDRYLKEYTTELIRYQWGINMSKFDGMQLPGGVTINGRQMVEDANQNLERLRQEIRDTYELPTDFLIG